jgi:hypothetical protein
MSAIIFGIKPNSIIPQPDFKSAKSANGGWTASQSYMTKRGALDNPAIRALFPSGERATVLDPNLESFFSFLKLVEISDISNLPGGFVSITVLFAGMQPSSGGGEGAVNSAGEVAPTYSLRGVARNNPLSEHWKWKQLEEPERVALGKILSGEYAWGPDPFSESETNATYIPGNPNTILPVDPITSDDGIRFALRISQGVTSYEAASFEWSKQWQSTVGIQDAQLEKLGKIDTPPGNPPTITGNRNWMLTSADQVQAGDGDYLFTNQVNYTLSEPGGWDTFLQDD